MSAVSVSVASKIAKTNVEKRLVTGIVLEPGEIDSQNDTISAETIQTAAHNFLASYNEDTELGLMHRQFGELGLELAESWIAPFDFELGGQSVKEGSWIMVVKVLNDDTWAKVKSGELTGFSIGGSGIRETVDGAVS